MFMRLVHLVMYSQASFFFISICIALHEISYNFFLFYSTTDQYLDCFQFEDISNNTAMNIPALMSLGTHEHAFQLSNYQDGFGVWVFLW